MSGDNKKRGLGRGLDALFGDVKREEKSFEPKLKRGSELEAKPSSTASPARTAPPVTAPAPKAGPAGTLPTRKLSVEKLTPGKFQPRRHFNDDAIDQLADSIAVHGVLQPILVRPLGNPASANTMYEIIAGERRWRASQKAQLHEVPVVVQEMDDNQALEIALIENLQREDLTSMEEAEGYQRLMDEFGHTQEQLSQQLGKSRSHVANTLRLLKLSPDIRNKIQSGLLSAGHARTLIGAKNPEELADAIMKRNLSVRQAEKLAQKVAGGKAKVTPKTKGFKQKDVDILALEQKMTTTLGLRVTIEQAGEGKTAGRLIVDYKSYEQLDDVLARLSVTPAK